MVRTVKKRNGNIVPFDRKKIERAITAAWVSTKPDYPKIREATIAITNEVLDRLPNKEQVSVEEIQDVVEEQIDGVDFKVAKAYSNYRYIHDIARKKYKDLIQVVSEKLNASNVQNQNANVDEKSFGGRKGEANSAIMKQYALDYCMSDMAKNNHLNNEIYIHDLDSYSVGEHNCITIPFDDLLANGFNTRQTDVRPAQSISTAFQLVAVLFQIQSLQQFGGVAASHLDWTMVPYVRKSFSKHFKDGLKYIENIEVNIPKELEFKDAKAKQHVKAYNYAMDMTKKETYQAVEGMYHNLNTLQSRSGNQLPFTSINYGTCTLPEGRLVIKALLDVCIKGIGKLHRTSVFPCGIFQVGNGINKHEGDPNYDLFQLALKSTAKRLYPNYANIDWSGNKGYDKNNIKTYFSTMGALDAKEHLYIKIDNQNPIDISIKDFFDYCKTGKLNNARPTQIYVDKRPIVQKESKHIQSKSNIDVGAGVYAITYMPEDITYIGSSSNVNRRLAEHRSHIKAIGSIDASACFEDNDLDNYKFEILKYTDNYKEEEKRYIETIPNINYKGIMQKYYKQHQVNSIITKKPKFKQNKNIKQDLISLEDKDIKVLDRNKQWTKVKFIFKNNKYNSPYMLHIWYKEHDKEYCISCTEDHPLWNGKSFTRADKLKIGDNLYRLDGLKMPIVKISWNSKPADSYDIGTVTGSFIGSDVIMHNCRTANGYDINGFGQLKDGRGNIAPVTIILPTLAMEANRDVETFIKLLDKKIDEAVLMLKERYNLICSQPMDSAKFMYENNIMAGYDGKTTESALKHGTLAVGMLGLAECLELLIGKNQTTSEGMVLAKRICQLYKDKCNYYKEKDHLNFGVYYTPAENLCFTAMKKFKKKYGIIPKVSDKKYFTNSVHVPVWEKMNAFEKINIESQLDSYSSAGCIFYIENDNASENNIKGLEKIVIYALDKDIPYIAINSPDDMCNECGYEGKIENDCPVCGSNKITRLRRVTGYLTGNYTTAFNEGKQQEVEDRVSHTTVEMEQ